MLLLRRFQLLLFDFERNFDYNVSSTSKDNPEWKLNRVDLRNQPNIHAWTKISFLKYFCFYLVGNKVTVLDEIRKTYWLHFSKIDLSRNKLMDLTAFSSISSVDFISLETETWTSEKPCDVRVLAKTPVNRLSSRLCSYWITFRYDEQKEDKVKISNHCFEEKEMYDDK